MNKQLTTWMVVDKDGNGVIVTAATKKQAMSTVKDAVDAWRD